MIDWIKQQIVTLLEWFLELLGWYPKKLYAEIMQAVLDFLNSVTPPDFMDQAVSLLGQWSGPAGYFFGLFEFNWGIQLVISAITLRWVWSKIPFIGR